MAPGRIHAVVPIARADERQAVGAHAGERVGNRALAMAEQRVGFTRRRGVDDHVDDARRQMRRLQIGQPLVQDGAVAGRL